MRDQMIQMLIARKGAAARRRSRARGRAERLVGAELIARGLDPEEFVIGLVEVAQQLGWPRATLQRRIDKNLWGLGIGHGTVKIGRFFAVRREAIAEALSQIHRMHAGREPRQRPERPVPSINSALSALIAAVDAASAPVTLHQVSIASGRAYEPAELAAAALKAMRSGQLVREHVDRPTDIGPAKVWAYSPGPAFAAAKSRRPRVIARLQAAKSALSCAPAYTAQR